MASSRSQEYGYATLRGTDWSEYSQFRPAYPTSFFDKIFEYHERQPSAPWSTAHDVGAGTGIASHRLAKRFQHVVVSDPNEGYTRLASQALVEEAGLPASAFTFLQESAERSSVAAGSVDLITACECLHWTDNEAAMAEFHRQLKPGGSLVITYYTRPRLPNNQRAEQVFDKIYTIMSRKWITPVAKRAFRLSNTGYASLALPADRWEEVTRLYLNTGGDLDVFNFTREPMPASQFGPDERIEWREGDEDWSDEQGIDWFKGYASTWVPRTPESEIQDLWDELEDALAGQKTKIRSPLVMIFASKKDAEH